MFRNFFPKAMMFIFLLMLIGSLPSILFGGLKRVAAAPPVKSVKTTGVLIGFFNGVGNSYKEAAASTDYLASKFGDTSRSGKTVSYDTFYNHSFGRIPDLLEVFTQRMSEHDAAFQNHYELFWDAISGGGKLNAQSDTTPAVVSFAQYVTERDVKDVTGLKLSKHLQSDLRAHEAQLRKYIHEKQHLIFIAHSQGNLFANSAFDFAAPQGRKVSVIHVATASSITHGHYITADKDRVIDLLRTAQPGTGVPWGNVEIPAWIDRPCGVNGECDWRGHGFLAVYMNEQLKPVGEIEKAVREAIDAQ